MRDAEDVNIGGAKEGYVLMGKCGKSFGVSTELVNDIGTYAERLNIIVGSGVRYADGVVVERLNIEKKEWEKV